MTKPNRVRIAIVAAALFPMLLPVNAQAFTGRVSTHVAQVNASVFEVVPRGTGGGGTFWCGASDYARKTLGADWKATIYIARGLGPSVTTGRRSAVQFTLDPTAANIPATGHFISRNALETGESLSVQQAHRLCERSPARS